MQNSNRLLTSGTRRDIGTSRVSWIDPSPSSAISHAIFVGRKGHTRNILRLDIRGLPIEQHMLLVNTQTSHVHCIQRRSYEIIHANDVEAKNLSV